MSEAFPHEGREDATVLRVKDGDVLVVDVAYRPTMQQAQWLRELWSRELPFGVKVIIMSGVRKITVVEPDAVCPSCGEPFSEHELRCAE